MTPSQFCSFTDHLIVIDFGLFFLVGAIVSVSFQLARIASALEQKK